MDVNERLNKAAAIARAMIDKVNAIFELYVPMLHEVLPEMLNGYGKTAMDTGISICDRGLHVDPKECPSEYPQTGAAAAAQGWILELPVVEGDDYEHWHKTVNGFNVIMLLDYASSDNNKEEIDYESMDK